MSCPTIQSPVHCLVNHLSLWTAQDRHKAFNINKAPRTSPRTAVLSDPAVSAGVCAATCSASQGGSVPGLARGAGSGGGRWRRVPKQDGEKQKKNKTKTLVETKGFVWLHCVRPKSLTLGEARGESWGWGT